VTEGLTLLPPNGSDKRTKEVFVLSLERMNGRSGRGLGGAMDWMDGGLSGEWMGGLAAGRAPRRYCCWFS